MDSHFVQPSTLAETFGRALETLAFISPLPCEVPLAAPTDALLVQLPLGAGDGTSLEIVAGTGLGRLMVANLLGGEPEGGTTREPCVDALKELANVTAGALLRGVDSRGRTMATMGIPRVVPFDSGRQWVAFLEAPGASVFDAEGHTVAIRVRGAP